jgi:hypothetical protein
LGIRGMIKSSKVSAKIKTASDLIKYISRLPIKAPVADRFEKDLVRLDLSDRDRRWYRHQKEHWLGWLGDYGGPGYYGRQASTKRHASMIYNRIKNPAMLLWLVDASGVSPAVVRKARLAGLKAKPNFSSESGAIRAVAHWELVEEALTKKSKSKRS